MNKRLLALLALSLLLISVPALVAAAPSEHHHYEQKNTPDWKSYPADIQALKLQLDKIRTEQKSLFVKMKSQHDLITEARKTLTTDQRTTLKEPAKLIIEQMKTTRDSIHALRKQKHEAWDSFYAHAESKKWSVAKSELQAIIKQKEQIVQKQQNILKLQKQLIALVSPTHESHVHSGE
ncbi:hypothetical protein [Cohnella abietis]|uniref:Uncharacterized protein n=1 Tax=Cohnella abietis TaxID=2507935 RepID=A0A3T1DDP6_9BACL|nr:hypothetical protein [Cohnella abietis]BBI36098.1 hypothetical protein KCTCHS21_54970 [Cohnella abietis]